jgi:16S rRNA (guanine527-N7)-methyltransferase
MAVFNRDTLAAQLRAGADQLNVALSDAQLEQLLDYLAELLRWNRAYNLTAITEPEQMVVRHLLDSLAVVDLIDGERLLDVGTGPGLPGMVLAIAAPQRDYHLLDSNGKKTRFLFHARNQLGLDNVTEHHCRIEQHTPPLPYNQVISRAFSSLSAMLLACESLVAEGGSIVAMKGKLADRELTELAQLNTAAAWQITDTVALSVPGLGAEQRHAVVLRRSSES